MKGKTSLGVTRPGVIIKKLRGMFGASAQLQEGDLILKKKLESNNISERFHLNGKVTGRAKIPGEVFIGINDLFVPYEMKVAISKVLDNTKPGNVLNADDLTYADLSVFTDPATTGAVSEADAVKGLFGSSISMKANTYEVLNEMSLKRFYHSPQTQGSATTQPQLDDRGYLDILQPAIFSGQDDNLLELIAAPGADFQLIGGAGNSDNYLSIYLKGIVVRNGAQPATWTEFKKIIEEQTANRVLL
jgi:hypothetical protein